MKKPTVALLALCICAAGCSNAGDGIMASGTVETDEYDVFSQVSGMVLEVRKSEGDIIEAGETVFIIDDTDAQSNMRQAEANVRIAQAKLDAMLAGTRVEEIAQAKAVLTAAQANFDELSAGNRPEQIKSAEAAQAQAKANLDSLILGNRPQQIEQAQYQLQQAESALTAAESSYDYQRQSLVDAETLYSAGALSKLDMDKAQVEADGALNKLNAANEQVNISKAQLELLERGATPEAIAEAQAKYNQAKANADLLKNGATEQAIAAAQANVDKAQASLDYLQNGYSKQDIEQAEAGLDAVRAELELCKSQLDKYEVKSPVSGVLLYKNMDIGQIVNPGSNVFTVEATDGYWIKVYIPQKDNGKIAIGDPVDISVSNITGEAIAGTVTWISPKAEFTPKNTETMDAKQENTVFAIKVSIDSHMDAVRPGMNAYVTLRER